MHAKVYWAERSGAVIASANLTDNAFGSGDLREAGIALASGQIDIERLISSIDASPVTPEALEKLRREEAIERSQRTGRPTNTVNKLPSHTHYRECPDLRLVRLDPLHPACVVSDAKLSTVAQLLVRNSPRA
jgi:hypothetical protein